MTLTETKNSAVFKPTSKAVLATAVAECLKLSKYGDCFWHKHGPIGKWDTSLVDDMSGLFQGAASFNADISGWNVAKVTTTANMFKSAASFNIDISKWDVSKVTDMSNMFNGATAFSEVLCKAWRTTSAKKDTMFAGSSGSISTKQCPAIKGSM